MPSDRERGDDNLSTLPGEMAISRAWSLLFLRPEGQPLPPIPPQRRRSAFIKLSSEDRAAPRARSHALCPASSGIPKGLARPGSRDRRHARRRDAAREIGTTRVNVTVIDGRKLNSVISIM